ncbi:S1 family peptidase [Mycolicibacter minnesotensis]
MWAHKFFNLVHDPAIAAAIGKHEPPWGDPKERPKGSPPPTVPFEPWSVADFSRYLSTLGLRAAGEAVTLQRILSAMERAGLLLPLGWDPRMPIMGQRYISQGGASKGQIGGNLWLAEIFGAELIIPSYQAVTLQLAGHDEDGSPVGSWGTGLIVDHNLVITNKHVVTGLAGFSAGLSVYPSSNRANAEQVECTCIAKPHPALDVAVIEAQLPEGKYLPRLAGMAFRDPEWADEVYVFGYPRVPMTAEMALTVQRGEVVNPAAETIPDRHKIFLYSAIARPGNSGGPVVAQDGRVIGLVVEDSAESSSTDAGPAAAPFYRGIPSSEVVRALEDLGHGGVIGMDALPGA